MNFRGKKYQKNTRPVIDRKWLFFPKTVVGILLTLFVFPITTNAQTTQADLRFCPSFSECRTTGIFSRGSDYIVTKQALISACKSARTLAVAVAKGNDFPFNNPAEYAEGVNLTDDDWYHYENNKTGAGAPILTERVQYFNTLANAAENAGCSKPKYREITTSMTEYRKDFAGQLKEKMIQWQWSETALGRRDIARYIEGMIESVEENFIVNNNAESLNLRQTIFGFAEINDIYNPDIAAIPSSRVIFQSDDASMFGRKTDLNDYTGGATTGREKLRFVVERLMNFIKRVLTPIFMAIMIFMGVELFLGGRSSAEEELSEKKKQFFNMTNGFIVFALVIVFVDFVLFGNEGEILRDNYVTITNEETGEVISAEYQIDLTTSDQAAKRGFEQMEGWVGFLQTLWVAVSVLFLVTSALRLVFGGGSDDAQSNAKQHVLYAILSVVFVISARPVLNMFTGGSGRFGVPTVTPLIEFFAKWSDYLLGFIGFLGIIALIYAGARLVLQFGNEDAVSEAKKIGTYAVIGLILAFSTWTIINFFANPAGEGLQTGF